MPKSLVVTGPYQVEVMEYTDPPLEENQVLIKTELASGKHGTMTAGFDGSVFRGQDFDQRMRLFVPKEEEAPKAPSKPDPRRATGTSGVGIVQEVGSAVTRWKKGDRVLGHMSVKETNICREDSLHALGHIDPELALCIEPAYVSIHCVRESNVRYGDSVAVVGLGAIGLLAVVIAREAGADKVFAVDPLAKRREWAEKNGADKAFDPMESDPAVPIHEMTGGKGVDVAIEVSGAYPALNTAIRCTRICGTVCSAGFYQGESKGLWLGREWHHNRLSIVVPHGCGWAHPPRDYPRWDRERAQEVLVSMMRQGKLKAPGLIDPIVSIDEMQGVFDLIRDDPGKVIKYGVRFR
jgi:threonine dehydrogenase-like Zn-dependent dehydrogenase